MVFIVTRPLFKFRRYDVKKHQHQTFTLELNADGTVTFNSHLETNIGFNESHHTWSGSPQSFGEACESFKTNGEHASFMIPGCENCSFEENCLPRHANRVTKTKDSTFNLPIEAFYEMIAALPL